MTYHCFASSCTMLCSVACLKCKLQLNLQFIQKKKKKVSFSWSFLNRWHSVFRPFLRSFLVKITKVAILTINFTVWVSLCCWLNSSLFLFWLHKKVVPSVQGSSFCGIWERWLVGSLTLNFGEANSWVGLESVTYCLGRGHLPTHQVLAYLFSHTHMFRIKLYLV